MIFIMIFIITIIGCDNHNDNNENDKILGSKCTAWPVPRT